MRWLRRKWELLVIAGFLVVAGGFMIVFYEPSDGASSTDEPFTHATTSTPAVEVVVPPTAKPIEASYEVARNELYERAKMFEEAYHTYSYKDTEASHKARIGDLASQRFMREGYLTVLSTGNTDIQSERYMAAKRSTTAQVINQYGGDDEAGMAEITSTIRVTTTDSSGSLTSDVEVTTVWIKTDNVWQAYDTLAD